MKRVERNGRRVVSEGWGDVQKSINSLKSLRKLLDSLAKTEYEKSLVETVLRRVDSGEDISDVFKELSEEDPLAKELLDRANEELNSEPKEGKDEPLREGDIVQGLTSSGEEVRGNFVQMSFGRPLIDIGSQTVSLVEITG